jgi:hypothetical protein
LITLPVFFPLVTFVGDRAGELTFVLVVPLAVDRVGDLRFVLVVPLVVDRVLVITFALDVPLVVVGLAGGGRSSNAGGAAPRWVVTAGPAKQDEVKMPVVVPSPPFDDE